jgi:hypothetical protein
MVNLSAESQDYAAIRFKVYDHQNDLDAVLMSMVKITCREIQLLKEEIND